MEPADEADLNMKPYKEFIDVRDSKRGADCGTERIVSTLSSRQATLTSQAL